MVDDQGVIVTEAIGKDHGFINLAGFAHIHVGIDGADLGAGEFSEMSTLCGGMPSCLSAMNRIAIAIHRTLVSLQRQTPGVRPIWAVQSTAPSNFLTPHRKRR